MKIRLILLGIFLMLFVTFIGFEKPRAASAACASVTLSAGSSITFTVFPYSSYWYLYLSAVQAVYIQASGIGSNYYYGPGQVSGNGFPFGPSVITLTLIGSGQTIVTGCNTTLIGATAGGVTSVHFDDGRLNFADPWETTAIYCMGDGSVRVYVIGKPKWTIDFDASPAEIAKISKQLAYNTLIKKGRFAALSRLTNGSLQVSSPGLNPIDGDYIFIFQDCPRPPGLSGH